MQNLNGRQNIADAFYDVGKNQINNNLPNWINARIELYSGIPDCEELQGRNRPASPNRSGVRAELLLFDSDFIK